MLAAQLTPLGGSARAAQRGLWRLVRGWSSGGSYGGGSTQLGAQRPRLAPGRLLRAPRVTAVDIASTTAPARPSGGDAALPPPPAPRASPAATDLPPPGAAFRQLGINQELQAALDRLSITVPTEVQVCGFAAHPRMMPTTHGPPNFGDHHAGSFLARTPPPTPPPCSRTALLIGAGMRRRCPSRRS
jgi:hypothetical protein